MKRIPLGRVLLLAAALFLSFVVLVILWNGFTGNGWPWTEVYRVFVLVENPADLDESSDVRVDEEEVGVIEEIEGAGLATQLGLGLDIEQKPLAESTRFRVRTPADGESYLEIFPGEAGLSAPPGFVFPLRNSEPRLP